MPRRPRPASRAPTAKAIHSKRRPQITDYDKSLRQEPANTRHSDDSSDDEVESEGTTEGPLHDNGEFDVDAPRVVQWAGESDLEENDNDEESIDEPVAGPSSLDRLQDDISHLPLGTLLRAQQALAQGEAEQSDSESASSHSEPETLSSTKKASEKVAWSTTPRTDIAKRRNKHAPMEVTSKRPVPRRNVVIEARGPQPRDPRFLPVTGQLDTHKFRQQYNFLFTARETELATLRENLKRARKLLENSPRGLRNEREAEVSRLELAVKRSESLVQRDRREKVEAEALSAVKQEENQKRKTGKGQWWMKNSDKKELLAKARYDALAAEGGRQAVKKAIEKKQKKISQKEKRSRPYIREEGQTTRPVKRRKVV